jgi:hypothetical protein
MKDRRFITPPMLGRNNIAFQPPRAGAFLRRGGHRRAIEILELLGGRPSHVFRSRSFRSLPDLELDAVTLAQVVEPFPVHSAPVEEILLPSVVLDKAKTFVDS